MNLKVTPPGLLNPDDYQLIEKYSRIIKEGFRGDIQDETRGVDIGTFQGKSAVIMSEFLDVVIAVDIFDSYKSFYSGKMNTPMKLFRRMNPFNMTMVSQNLMDYENIRVFEGDAREQKKYIGNDFADIILYDGSELFQDIEKTCNNWFCALRSGGYFLIAGAITKRSVSWGKVFVYQTELPLHLVEQSSTLTVLKKF